MVGLLRTPISEATRAREEQRNTLSFAPGSRARRTPSRAGDERFRRWYAKYVRAMGGPTAVRTFLQALFEMDRAYLSTICLVLRVRAWSTHMELCPRTATVVAGEIQWNRRSRLTSKRGWSDRIALPLRHSVPTRIQPPAQRKNLLRRLFRGQVARRVHDLTVVEPAIGFIACSSRWEGRNRDDRVQRLVRPPTGSSKLGK